MNSKVQRSPHLSVSATLSQSDLLSARRNGCNNTLVESSNTDLTLAASQIISQKSYLCSAKTLHTLTPGREEDKRSDLQGSEDIIISSALARVY